MEKRLFGCITSMSLAGRYTCRVNPSPILGGTTYLGSSTTATYLSFQISRFNLKLKINQSALSTFSLDIIKGRTDRWWKGVPRENPVFASGHRFHFFASQLRKLEHQSFHQHIPHSEADNSGATVDAIAMPYTSWSPSSPLSRRLALLGRTCR